MAAFVCFVVFAVAYAAGMRALGRRLRSRGHGSRLDALAARHQQARDRVHAVMVPRFRGLKRARRGEASTTNDTSD